jgi:hypothetical protein
MRDLLKDRATVLTLVAQALIVLLLFNAPLPSPGVRFREAVQGVPVWQLPVTALSYYADWTSGDIRRYFSFASLMVGEPADVDDLLEGWGELGALSSAMLPPRHVKRPQVPYRDFIIEYPPGVLPPILLPRLFASSLAGYTLLFQLQMGLLYMLATLVALHHSGAGRRSRTTVSLLATLALGPILLQRLDLLVSFLLVAAVAAAARRLPVLSGVCLALGTGVKLFPVVLAPLFCIYFTTRERKQFILALACTLAVLFLPAWLAGGERFGLVFAYHGARPIQLESLYAGGLNLYNWMRPGSVHFEVSFGSGNLVSPFEPVLKMLGTCLPLGLVGLVTVLFARGEKSAAMLARATLAGVLAVLSTSRVLSAQYLVWLFPLGLLLRGPNSGRILSLFLLGAVLTQLIYPVFYGRLEELHPGAGLLLCARNGVLLYTLYLTVRPWLRASPSDPASETL